MSSTRSGGSGQDDLWVARRQTGSDPWGEPVNLGSTVNSSYQEWFSSISEDGLSQYFCSTRPGGSGGWDLWMTTRGTTDEDWDVPLNLGQTVNSSADEYQPNILADGCTLLLCSTRPGGCGGLDIWITKRDTKNDPWGAPLNLGTPVNSPANDGRPSMSPDGLKLFFRSDRPGGFGGGDIWLATRATTNASWGEPINLGPTVNTVSWECGPSISRDGSTLYFHSNRPDGYGSWDIWQVSIEPVVDFTCDYQVDIEDLIILIESWGQNEPLYDIGPTPLGDGVVDAADLQVLMSFWGQDANFIAHWKLDETGGDIAYDSAGENHAAVMGDPIWQRKSGQVDGALQLDGIDDYLIAPFILDPTKQPFSVFAWIKGGQPEQTVISQQGAFGEWLSVDPAGTLATGLTFPLPPVTSDIVITDGRWHDIGLVSDGSGLSLYVDDIEVTRSDISPVLPAYGDLQIGVGMNLEPGTFWSGLIDDVRIYDRAVKP